MKHKKAVFIDRDGTINEEVGHINHESRFVLIPGTIKALKILQDLGFEIIILSYQPGIAQGLFSCELVEKVHESFKRRCSYLNIKITEMYYCPHDKFGKIEKYRIECSCKKPNNGLITKAVSDHKIDLNQSYLIADNYESITMGREANITSIMVLTGYGLGEYEYNRLNWIKRPNFIARDLLDSVNWIIQQQKRFLPKSEYTGLLPFI